MAGEGLARGTAGGGGTRGWALTPKPSVKGHHIQNMPMPGRLLWCGGRPRAPELAGHAGVASPCQMARMLARTTHNLEVRPSSSRLDLANGRNTCAAPLCCPSPRPAALPPKSHACVSFPIPPPPCTHTTPTLSSNSTRTLWIMASCWSGVSFCAMAL